MWWTLQPSKQRAGRSLLCPSDHTGDLHFLPMQTGSQETPSVGGNSQWWWSAWISNSGTHLSSFTYCLHNIRLRGFALLFSQTVCVFATQSCPTLCDPVDCSPPGFSVHGISRLEYWGGLPFPSPGDLPDPGIDPRSPPLQADFLPSEPPGSNTYLVDFCDDEME